MGSHTFTWPHAASEVFVTGTFDNWGKTIRLDRHGEDFHKTVDLPAEKTYYKFVVDGNWTTDHTIAQETDESGNVNNVLTVADLKSAPASHSFLSSAAPAASTAALAGSQPLTGKREMDDMPGVTAARQQTQRNESFKTDIPGSFPQTPANELQQFSVNPIPATEGAGNPIKLAPGEPVPHPSTYTSNTVESSVRSDPSLKRSAEDEEQAFGVAPIPATEGAGNPIKLAAGEPVPHPSTFTSNTIESSVRSDPTLKSGAEDEEQAFGVAPIPATGGIGNPIKLAAGEPVPHPSTLTGNTVDSTVSNMRSETGAPVLPPALSPASEREAYGGSIFGLPSVGGTMIPESSLPMGAGATSFEEPSFTTSSVAPGATTATLAGAVPIRERGVPEVVTESQQAAHVGPEASANDEAVAEKSALEEELKSTIPEARATSEAVGTGSASEAAGTGSAPVVPAVVTDSQNRADIDPEAAAEPAVVSEKAAVEDELKQVVPEQPATSSSGIFGSSERGLVGALAGGAAVAGAAVAAGAYAARDKVAEYTQDTPATTSTTTSAVDNTVPAVVTESQLKAHAAPEASSSVEAVQEKSAVENELKSVIPEAPSTSESGILGKSEGGISGTLAAGAAALTGTAAAGAYAARDKAAEYSQGTSATSTSVGNGVPAPVLESQIEARADPEASGSVEAVREKSAVENELKKVVPEEPATSESGVFGKSEGGIAGTVAAGGAAVAGVAVAGAYAARDKAAETTGSNKNTFLPSSVQSAIDNMNTYAGSNSTTPAVAAAGTSATTAREATVPEVVTESQQEAHFSPEAAAEPEVVAEKSAVEKELLDKVPITEESGEPAPTTSAALTETAPVNTAAATSAIPEEHIAERSTGADTYPEEEIAERSTGVSTTAAPAERIAERATAPATGTADPTTDAAVAATGLNAPASSQAQPGTLSAKPVNDSRDVSPMSHPGAHQQAESTLGAENVKPTTTETPPQTPQATPSKSKRTSSFFRSTPESNRTSMSHVSESGNAESKPKKKGFLSKLKEKFKN